MTNFFSLPGGGAVLARPGRTLLASLWLVLLPWLAGAQAPVITSFAPAVGAVGTDVVLTGTDFTAVSAVRFGSVNAPTFTVSSPTSLTVQVPAGFTLAPST